VESYNPIRDDKSCESTDPQKKVISNSHKEPYRELEETRDLNSKVKRNEDKKILKTERGEVRP
jgi:hypothetical protein